MSLSDTTTALKQDRKALVGFLTAGYPDEETFLDLVRAASAAGCDIIEIGIPFSDPIADGPLIQASSKVALDGGITLARCIELAKQLSSKIPTPLVFMSYYNPILRMGNDTFAARAREAGVRGLIVPDVPLEESAAIRSAANAADITYIDLIAPTSSDDRIERITGSAQGFVYLVSVTGVTGVRSPEAGAMGQFVARVRGKTDVPLYIGFGISDATRARQAVQHADGVIIGSALVKLIQSAESREAAASNVDRFLRDVRAAIDESRDHGHIVSGGTR